METATLTEISNSLHFLNILAIIAFVTWVMN